jgi:hypothetical protein
MRILQAGEAQHIMPPTLRDHLASCTLSSPERLPAEELILLDCKRTNQHTFKWSYKPQGHSAMPSMLIHALGGSAAFQDHDPIVPYWAEPNLPKLPDVPQEPVHVHDPTPQKASALVTEGPKVCHAFGDAYTCVHAYIEERVV